MDQRHHWVRVIISLGSLVLTPLLFLACALNVASTPTPGAALAPIPRLPPTSEATRPTSIVTSTPPNVILIVVDALRADHVSAYGYGRPTTPNLDSWIGDAGVRFADVSSASAWTFPANAGMLTGRMPSRFGVAWSAPSSTLPVSATLLAEFLHQAGYRTVGVVAAHFMQSIYGFAQGFDVYSATVRSDPGSARAAEVNQMVTAWLDNVWQPISNSQPLFLIVYYFDPHTWYDPPPPYDTLYDSTYTGTITPAVFANGRSVVEGQVTLTSRDVEHLQALYDGEITYWDTQLGALLTALTQRHVIDHALIIVTSDHGQLFGEHGQWVHHNGLYEEVLRVPLFIRYSGVISPGLIITSPVQTTDIIPSVLDWLNLTMPADLDGQSVVPLIEGSGLAAPREIYSEMDGVTNPQWGNYWIAPRYEMRAIRLGDWKYIHYDGLRGGDELYPLQLSSQYEITNEISLRPDVADTLLQMLQNRYPLHNVFVNVPLMAR